MTSTCFDCQKVAPRFWTYDNLRVCDQCSGWRFELAMRNTNQIKMYLFNNQLFNSARSFRLEAIVFKGKGDIFPDIDTVQAVFDNSVWHGVISWDNIDGSILMKRTKKKFMPNGDEI